MVTAGEATARTAPTRNGTSGAERRNRNSVIPRTTVPTRTTGTDVSRSSGLPVVMPTATVPIRAMTASNAMLRGRRPGHTRSLIPMVAAEEADRGVRVALGRTSDVNFRMTRKRRSAAGSAAPGRRGRGAAASSVVAETGPTGRLGGHHDHGQRTDQEVRRPDRRRRRLVRAGAWHGDRLPR